MAIIGEYIWIDGGVPTKKLRSKTKIITALGADHEATLADFPAWQFDGSSTGQAEGDSSDCLWHLCAFAPIQFVDSVPTWSSVRS